MVFGTLALAAGKHLIKQGIKWAKKNPDAIGRGINTLTKFTGGKLPKFIHNAARVAQAMSNKGSYVNRLASNITNDSTKSIEYKKPQSQPIQSEPVKKRVYGGGYTGCL